MSMSAMKKFLSCMVFLCICSTSFAADFESMRRAAESDDVNAQVGLGFMYHE